MKKRKEFHLFSLGILLFTLTLTIVSGRIAIHAADLNTELPANDSTEISSEIVFVFANLFPPVFQLFSVLIKIEMSVFIMDKSLQYRFGIFRGRNHRCFRWNFGRNFRGVKKVIGINPVVMRPPGGSTSSNIKSWVRMPSIIWSIDTLDWKTRDSASTQKAVLNHIKDGDIVLMHDLYKATATASQTIIPELTRRGYQLVTVSELAECRGGMKQNKSYSKFPKKQK